MPSVRLIVGLGNPGPEHAAQRHNVGFMTAEAIASQSGTDVWAKAFSSLTTSVTIDNQKVWLCKPQTYMNRSGKAVGDMARYYQIAPEEILVIHDELDLVFGKVRIKQGGGHGGHNGLRDIDAHIGKEYWRMRIGIGHPGDKNQVTGYVLHGFGKEERRYINELNDVIARELSVLFTTGHEAFMTRIALKCPTPDEKTENPVEQ